MAFVHLLDVMLLFVVIWDGDARFIEFHLLVVEEFAEVGDVQFLGPFLVVVALHFLDVGGVQLTPFLLEMVKVVLDLEATISNDGLLELLVLHLIDDITHVMAETFIHSHECIPAFSFLFPLGCFLAGLVLRSVCRD